MLAHVSASGPRSIAPATSGHDASSCDEKALDMAAARLMAGGLVVVPTETFFALAALPFDGQALAALFAAKGRRKEKAVALMAADRAMVDKVATLDPRLAPLADAFWPGPLTICLNAVRPLPAQVVDEQGLVGIRITSHPFVQALCRCVNSPLVATSANLSGQPPVTSAAQIDASLRKRALIVDMGETQGGLASTVIEPTVDGLKILRHGAITQRQLNGILPHISIV